MDYQKIIEMPGFEYTPQGFVELKKVLKNGKAVRNPFAKYYAEKVEVTVIKDTRTELLLSENS